MKQSKFKQTSGIAALGAMLWIIFVLCIVWILPIVAIRGALLATY